MINKHALIIAAVLSVVPSCNKKPDATCYKVHAMIIQTESDINTDISLAIFDALEKNTPEGRDDAMLMLNVMIEHYPTMMALLEKPPYNHKDTSTTATKVEAFLRDKKVLIQSIRDSVKSRAEADKPSPGVQRRLSTLPALPKDS